MEEAHLDHAALAFGKRIHQGTQSVPVLDPLHAGIYGPNHGSEGYLVVTRVEQWVDALGTVGASALEPLEHLVLADRKVPSQVLNAR